MNNIVVPTGFRRGQEISKDYNEIYFHEEDDVRQKKLEMWIAKQVGEILVEKYPNRQWNVIVDIPGDMIIIACPSVSHLKGYHLRMRRDTIQILQEKAVKVAGEILERYGLSRDRKFNPDLLEDLDRIGPYEEAITADSDGIDPIIKRHR